MVNSFVTDLNLKWMTDIQFAKLKSVKVRLKCKRRGRGERAKDQTEV